MQGLTPFKSNDEAERLYAQIAASFPPQERLERRFSFDEQNDVRLARQQASQCAAREIRQGVESFVGECVTELRRQTAQLCGEMLVSIHSGKTGGVHQRTFNRLTRFIDEFKQLNFAGDQEMEQQLDRMPATWSSASANSAVASCSSPGEAVRARRRAHERPAPPRPWPPPRRVHPSTARYRPVNWSGREAPRCRIRGRQDSADTQDWHRW